MRVNTLLSLKDAGRAGLTLQASRAAHAHQPMGKQSILSTVYLRGSAGEWTRVRWFSHS